MGVIVKPSTFSANTTISSSDVNNDFDTLYNEFNGNIAAANLASNAVTTAKIADANVTTAKIADANVTTAKIANLAVTAAKIANGTITPTQLDLSTAGASMWYQEIARLTLGSNGDTMTVPTFTAKKYLRIIVIGIATGGTIRCSIRFNADSGSNYAFRKSENTGAETTGNTQSAIQTETAAAQNSFLVADVVNISASEKLVTYMNTLDGGAGVGNAPNHSYGSGKWVNTSTQITAVTIFNDGTGDFSNAGSEVIVLGHD